MDRRLAVFISYNNIGYTEGQVEFLHKLGEVLLLPGYLSMYYPNCCGEIERNEPISLIRKKLSDIEVAAIYLGSSGDAKRLVQFCDETGISKQRVILVTCPCAYARRNKYTTSGFTQFIGSECRGEHTMYRLVRWWIRHGDLI
jgi:hypothetical protein